MGDTSAKRAEQIAKEAYHLDMAARELLLEKLSAESPELCQLVQKLMANQETIDTGENRAEETLAPENDHSREQPTQAAQATDGEEHLETIRLSFAKNGGSTADCPQESEQQVIAGEYEIVKQIGRGGMGTVYQAFQKSLRRHVALKVIFGQNLRSPAEIARFQVEAEAAARLDHPNIVPVYDVGEDQGFHYYAMAYVEGRSLSDMLQKGRNRIEPRTAAELMLQVCRAVQYAHERAVIHRDLKPANIILDKDGKPRLADFGLAKMQHQDDALTMTGQVLGTPSYMAPEQATSRLSEISNRTDIYSLGATLYALLCGKPPFRGNTVIETLRLVVDAPPPPLRNEEARVPRDLEVICEKCMSKKPEERYESAGAVADDLENYLQGYPIRARPLNAWQRGIRWCQRNPVVASLTAATAVAVVAGTLFSLAFALEANKQAESAKAALAEARRNASQLREAIQDSFIFASENVLADEPGMQAAREVLLKNAQQYFEELIILTPEDDRTRRELSQSRFMLGKIEAELGDAAGAAESFQRAGALQEKILEDAPQDVTTLAALAKTHTELARLAKDAFHQLTKIDSSTDLTTTQAEESHFRLQEWMKHSELAIDLRQRVQSLLPDDPEAVRLLANAVMNLAIASAEEAALVPGPEQIETTRALFLDAQQLRSNAQQEFPEEQTLNLDIARGYVNMGQFEGRAALLDTNDQQREASQSRAAEMFTKAISNFEQLPDNVGGLNVQLERTNCYRSRADLRALQGKKEEAEADYRKALKLAEALSDRNPNVYRYRTHLAEIQYNLCLYLFAENRAAEAIQQLHDCQQTLLQAVRIDPTNQQALNEFSRYTSQIVSELGRIGVFDLAKSELKLAKEQLGELPKESQVDIHLLELDALRSELEQLAAERNRRT